MAADWCSRQWIGGRARQEDACAVLPLEDGRVLAVVADGLGGHAAGDLASRIVVEAIVDAFAADARRGTAMRPAALLLRSGLAAAGARMAAAESDDPRVRGMASTVVAAVAGGGRRGVVEWLSVGDSILWLWCDGRLVRLNADHSGRARLEAAVAEGSLDADAAAADPRRHVLQSAVSSATPELVDEPATPTAFGDGDALLLASDGILSLGRAEIGQVLAGGAGTGEPHAGLGDPGAWCAALVDRVVALGLPGQDNVTVIALRTPSSRSTS